MKTLGQKSFVLFFVNLEWLKKRLSGKKFIKMLRV